jgi:hypothetical protein
LIKKNLSLGIGAAGLLRLLLVTRTYTTCKGGATVLTYVVNNTVANNGRVVATTVDYVRNWQVCIK